MQARMRLLFIQTLKSIEMTLSIKQEIWRKSFHLLCLIFPIIFAYFGKIKAMTIFIAFLILMIFIEIIRFNKQLQNITLLKLTNIAIFQRIKNIVVYIAREEEIKGKRLFGATWLILGAVICFGFFEKNIATISFIILAIADTNSAIIGKSFVGKKFIDKTTFGSLAFFISSLIIVIFSTITIGGNYILFFNFVITIVLVTVVEAFKFRINIDDNFTIPISFCTIATILNHFFPYGSQ